MSMIDTWAATGVGAFSLSREWALHHRGLAPFPRQPAPDGLFTVSRWYAPDNVDETGRLLSLAKATLIDFECAAPEQHMFLVLSIGCRR